VVDDDVLVRAQLCAMLHGSDYEVETAASGEDALRVLRSYPCDIVVTDWQMPHMDGITLCRQVRSIEQHEHVYMLMLTVRQSPQELLAGFAAGVDDYLVKGISSEELLARLERGRCLANWRAAYQASDDKTEAMSLTDSETGAYNLAYLIQHLPRELARAERYGRSLSVLNCVINRTAQANEQFVGAVGAVSPVDSELARDFVSRSTACIRAGDWLVRTGENEFMIVLPETDRKGAQCVASKLGEAFARQEATPIKDSFGRDVKIDVTAIDPGSDADGAANLRALLSKAKGLRHRNQHDAKRAPDAGMHYLSDFVSGGDTNSGRNWPVN